MQNWADETDRIDGLQQIPLHHSDGTAGNGDLSRLGVDLYLTGATHIITLVKAEFLWRLGVRCI